MPWDALRGLSKHVIASQRHLDTSQSVSEYLRVSQSISEHCRASQFLFRVASLRHVSGQHELLTHSRFKIFKGFLTTEMKTLKSMEPLLSESNFWNIWSTNVLDFVPVRTELYISIILSLLSCPSGLSWPTWWQSMWCGIHMLRSSPP